MQPYYSIKHREVNIIWIILNFLLLINIVPISFIAPPESITDYFMIVSVAMIFTLCIYFIIYSKKNANKNESKGYKNA